MVAIMYKVKAEWFGYRKRCRNDRRLKQGRQHMSFRLMVAMVSISVFGLLCFCLITPATATVVVDDEHVAETQQGKTAEMPHEMHPIGVVVPMESADPPMNDDKGCKADMSWPVLPSVVVGRFKAPAQIWAPGHRGVDIAAVEDTPLLAPADGFISFVGIVAGKSVVSIRHKSLTLTLEPAQTLLPIGTPVKRGLPIGIAKGLSDHCTGICVHWGIRKSRTEYRDPQKLASKRKIVLKQVGVA